MNDGGEDDFFYLFFSFLFRKMSLDGFLWGNSARDFTSQSTRDEEQKTSLYGDFTSRTDAMTYTWLIHVGYTHPTKGSLYDDVGPALNPARVGK